VTEASREKYRRALILPRDLCEDDKKLRGITMPQLHGLVAYPSEPKEIGSTIKGGLEVLEEQAGGSRLKSWEENDIAGYFIDTPILENIATGNVLVADITRLNFNVVYEVGYAIGREKRVLLTCNAALVSDKDLMREVGIFDTLGFREYTNSAEFAGLLSNISDLTALKIEDHQISTRTPVYILLPRMKGDAEIRVVSRLKKARLQFRSFDPEEQGRLSAREAIGNGVSSHGVVIPLLSKERVDATVHNLRAAFAAGLSNALDKQMLLLQPMGDPVPLDYRDLVLEYKSLDQINEHIAEFASGVTGLLQAGIAPIASKPQTFLARVELGASAAENEMFELSHYFLETDEYRRTLRGEVQIVTGRKGSGKTAMFAQVRNKLRQESQIVVLDLKPEGFQLLKFNELVLDLLQEGTKEHTVTAFWEYLLLLEICHKVLEKDRKLHLRDHQLYEGYQAISKAYREDGIIAEGDFAERMLKLTQRIADDFAYALRSGDGKYRLSSAEITELLYKHDVAALRKELTAYLANKKGLWILFDNLDKGWPAHGVSHDDLITVRCLLDAMRKLERDLQKREIPCRGIIFIRNDVYDLLLEETSDRGKTARVAIDWSDAELLRELLRCRFVSRDIPAQSPFEQIWREMCVSHIEGEESSQYIIERCLMRPRCLIDLLHYCRSHAVNLGHAMIEVDDVRQGEDAYSSDLVTILGLEMRDIYPEAGDVLYELIEMPATMHYSQIRELIAKVTPDDAKIDRIMELLLWYGVLGLKRGEDVTYIYSVKYDMKRLGALIEKHTIEEVVLYVNPAFWKGLEICP